MKHRLATLAMLSFACAPVTATEVREQHPGIDTSYESITTRDGTRLRVIVTWPLLMR